MSACRNRGRHPLVARLMTERLALKIYAKELAEVAGIKRDTLSDMEKGRRNPSLWAFDAIADAMGYELALVPKKKKEGNS